MHSRHFGRPVNGVEEVREVAALYAATIAVKLRRHGLQARGMTVSFSTSPHAAVDQVVHNPHRYTGFAAPTCSPPVLIRTATRAATEMIHPQARYARAGILLTDLTPAGFTPPLWDPADGRIDTAVDRWAVMWFDEVDRDLINSGLPV